MHSMINNTLESVIVFPLSSLHPLRPTFRRAQELESTCGLNYACPPMNTKQTTKHTIFLTRCLFLLLVIRCRYFGPQVAYKWGLLITGSENPQISSAPSAPFISRCSQFNELFINGCLVESLQRLPINGRGFTSPFFSFIIYTFYLLF